MGSIEVQNVGVHDVGVHSVGMHAMGVKNMDVSGVGVYKKQLYFSVKKLNIIFLITFFLLYVAQCFSANKMPTN